MATISLCMIVKNEEKVLARCLDSVKPAVDEILTALFMKESIGGEE